MLGPVYELPRRRSGRANLLDRSVDCLGLCTAWDYLRLLWTALLDCSLLLLSTFLAGECHSWFSTLSTPKFVKRYGLHIWSIYNFIAWKTIRDRIIFSSAKEVLQRSSMVFVQRSLDGLSGKIGLQFNSSRRKSPLKVLSQRPLRSFY